MMRKLAIALCAITLVIGLVSMGATGCTRGKKELPTQTIAAAAATQTPIVPGATPNPAVTTSTTPVAGPTTITALEPSPTPLVVVTVVPPATPVPSPTEYTVQAGDTLYTIAAHFGTTADAIVVLNGLPNANLIRVGQVLRIPGESTYTPGAGEYIVQAGDTLYSLASRFGTTVQAIQQANGIVNPTLIRVGQRLTIPQGNSTPPTGPTGTYIVQSGDTLYGIAANLGKNLWDIIAANNLSDPYYIFPGQVLIIP